MSAVGGTVRVEAKASEPERRAGRFYSPELDGLRFVAFLLVYLFHDGIESSRRRDDVEFIALFDAQLADEVQHVRFANVWVKKIVAREGARALMAMARAIAQANEAMKIIVGGEMSFYPVSDDLRREAGFSDAEIQTARELVDQK